MKKFQVTQKITKLIKYEFRRWNKSTDESGGNLFPWLFVLGKNKRGIITNIVSVQQPYDEDSNCGCGKMPELELDAFAKAIEEVYKNGRIPCAVLRVGEYIGITDKDGYTYRTGHAQEILGKMNFFLVSYDGDNFDVEKCDREESIRFDTEYYNEDIKDPILTHFKYTVINKKHKIKKKNIAIEVKKDNNGGGERVFPFQPVNICSIVSA